MADIWESPFGLSAKSQIRPNTSRHQLNYMREKRAEERAAFDGTIRSTAVAEGERSAGANVRETAAGEAGTTEGSRRE